VGGGTFLGGILHTLPFLLPTFGAAMAAALLVVLFELVALAWLRHRFFEVSFGASLGSVAVGGLLIATVSAGVGAAFGQSAG
jgi:hypothetical protein